MISAVILLIPLTTAITDGEMELLLVHGVWRHGDRSPTTTFPTDPIQEGDWTFGGGGFGQLSPEGMAQHLRFGKLLREFYVDTRFLNRKYSSKEIHIRSTDVNRTIISAMSNMLGMYGQNDNSSQAGVDYPKKEGWPAGYVPIPVHIVDYYTDHIGNPDAECKRKSLLWQMQIYKNETLRAKNKWFTDDLFSNITNVNNQIALYQSGIFNETLMMNNLNIGLEIQKVRGGSLFNEINSRMNAKLDCANRNSSECNWIKALKYYVYSAHDTTVYAFLSVMGIEERVVLPGGYPAYSAGAFVELWMNTTDNQPYFKLLYHKNEKKRSDTLNSITHFIGACGKAAEYCKLNIFRNFAALTKPDEPIETWCNVDPRKSSPPSWTLSTIALIILSSLRLNA
ncbi:hypothetical protein KIN20_032680 [Parelaphostrongylus tenuis]|uniref:acid phosphatase n=1 Tax=Parelaphostrongylus tenuis TaxID=148309 RepID=A0AAD5R7H7_PARTN|nr:hypothetical protein KIN20_032680 [Parelaphostrongylus tenuis]